MAHRPCSLRCVAQLLARRARRRPRGRLPGPALDKRALFAILGDATAPRELRAGAAVAIGVREEHASRLRIAADDVADPIVRRVAVASADGDAENAALLEAELDEVLRATAEGGTTSRR